MTNERSQEYSDNMRNMGPKFRYKLLNRHKSHMILYLLTRESLPPHTNEVGWILILRSYIINFNYIYLYLKFHIQINFRIYITHLFDFMLTLQKLNRFPLL